MDRSPEATTDGSSIRPVSTLRSHFENMLGAGNAPTTPSSASSKQISPQALGQPEDPDRPRSRLSCRASLDIPRESAKQDALQHVPPFAVVDALTSDVRLSRSSTTTPKPRPISMGPLSHSQSPPRVTVDSPRSPPRFDPRIFAPIPTRTSNHDPPRSAADRRSESPQASGLRHLRSSSRTTTPSIEARQKPFLPANPAVHSSTDPRKTSPPRQETLSQVQNPVATDSPPPINRAGKPKAFGRSPSAVNRNVTTNTLAPDSGVEVDERISPFSTPPSSEGSSPGENPTPPPIQGQKKARQLARSPSRNEYFEPPLNSHTQADGAKHDSVRHPSQGQSMHRQKAIVTHPTCAEKVLLEEKPGLPPRRDVSHGNVRNIASKAPDPPPARRSTEAPRTTSSAMNSRAMPPPPRRAQTSAPSISDNHTSAPPVAARSVSKASIEIRREPSQITQNRPWIADPDESDASTDRSQPALSDYPDTSQANRRPPYFRQLPHEIATKYETKLFAVCGEFVCTTGYVTRVWSLVTGEMIMSLVHGETVKVTAVCFKPARKTEDEGSRLWLGTSTGEMHEVDITTQRIVHTKSNAHARREIVKIYRHAAEMWSLDDDGKLHIWPPDEGGSSSLNQTPISYRMPKGHSCSIVAGSKLWIGTGKDVRIYQRSYDVDPFTPVSQRPLSQPNVGDITSAATISRQRDCVFFGHNDGKVTIYSQKDYSCLGVVNVSLYKISSLVGVGDYLWTGYNTGMIYVYDTTCQPWKVKKDWHAHDNIIAGIIVDRTSLWKLDRLQVVSLGTDNMLRVWDGMLTDDWLESDMQEHDADFCDFREVTAMVMTWNAGASKPTALRHDERDANFFRDLLQSSKKPPDILVFGFQELVDLEDKKVTAKSFFKSSKKKDAAEHEHMSHQYRAWRDHLIRCLEDYIPPSEPYTLLHTANLVGLFTCVFIKASERLKIRNVNAAEVKLGMGGLHGNKGALIVRFILDDSSLCFINCHLAAGQSQTVHRNNDIATILESSALPAQADPSARLDTFVGGGDGSMILDHEICILNGDLNYRIDTMPRDNVIAAVKANNLSKLLERDQLLLSRKKNPGFRLRAFNESTITFAPTYKYDVGTDNYDSSEKKRSPAWCDRLLYRGVGRIKQVEYRRHEVRVSDHRPVSGKFKLRIKTVSPKRRTVVQEQCEKRFEQIKQRIATETKLDYLVSVLGLSVKEAERLLKA